MRCCIALVGSVGPQVPDMTKCMCSTSLYFRQADQAAEMIATSRGVVPGSFVSRGSRPRAEASYTFHNGLVRVGLDGHAATKTTHANSPESADEAKNLAVYIAKTGQRPSCKDIPAAVALAGRAGCERAQPARRDPAVAPTYVRSFPLPL
jgi:hypothetical protein